jgi:hypothetical protein
MFKTILASLASIMFAMNPNPDPVLVEQAAAWQIVGLYQSAQNEAINCQNFGNQVCKHMAEDDALIRAEDWEQYARSLARGSDLSELEQHARSLTEVK